MSDIINNYLPDIELSPTQIINHLRKIKGREEGVFGSRIGNRDGGTQGQGVYTSIDFDQVGKKHDILWKNGSCELARQELQQYLTGEV